MIDLFGRILLYLLVAGLVGFIVGWLFRGLGLKARLDALAAEHEECGPRLTILADELERVRAANAQLDSRNAGLARDLRASQEAVGELRSQVAELEAALRVTTREPEDAPAHAGGGDGPDGLLARPEGPPDDLKKISGIGPVLERMLHGLGVFHYRQIARWSQADIQWVASNLEAFSGRILRDDWVAQARDLDANQGGGE